MNEYAEAIRRAIPARRALEAYGISVNRDGYAVCPFHEEKTASLRAYDNDQGWYCFGCHSGGSVIDLTMRLFHLSFAQAIIRMDSEFGLNLALGRPMTERERESARAERRRLEEVSEQRKWLCAVADIRWQQSFDDWLLWDEVADALSVLNAPEETSKRYAEAVLLREDARMKLDDAEDERRRALCQNRQSISLRKELPFPAGRTMSC